MEMISKLDDVLFFNISDQHQIVGPRGYINSKDDGYQIIRQIALPLVSYIYVEKVGSETEPLFYWKLFVDFEAIWEKQNGPLVFREGKGKASMEVVEEKPSKKKQAERRERCVNAEDN